MALDKAMNTARFGARKAKEVYAVEGLSGVMRRTRAWRRKQRAAAAAAPTLPHGPLPQRPTWHQHVLCVAERSLPQCYHYRVQQKRETCAHLGIPFDDVGLDDLGEVLTRMQLASMVIVYRLPGGPALDRVLEEARRLRIPVVYEVDDLVYRRDVTAANPNLDTLPKGLRSAVIRGSDRLHVRAAGRRVQPRLHGTTEPGHGTCKRPPELRRRERYRCHDDGDRRGSAGGTADLPHIPRPARSSTVPGPARMIRTSPWPHRPWPAGWTRRLPAG
ncbi:MAG: hypothetical protein V9G10_11390 [Candidatus Nanopelagicales bacterium]